MRREVVLLVEPDPGLVADLENSHGFSSVSALLRAL
jgi:hypothetical protein